MDTGRDDQVSLRAYQIWEAEGRPKDRQEEHWRRARSDVYGDGSDSTAPAPTPPNGEAASAPSREPPDTMSTPSDGQATRTGRREQEPGKAPMDPQRAVGERV